MKYITYETLDGNERYVIFDKLMDHSSMAHKVIKGKILGAGFVGFNEGGPHCYGKSVTMKVPSRNEQDSQLIQRINEL